VIAAMLLLQSDPLVFSCSTRANTCHSMTRSVQEGAQRCGVDIDLRDYTAGGVVVISDGAMYEVVAKGTPTNVQRACLAEAVRTAHARLYPAQSGLKN